MINIELFVMHDCQICPQMRLLFQNMHENGAFDQLEIIDIGEHPEFAQKHKIRTVPYYLIDGIAFNGLRTQSEIVQILSSNTIKKWKGFITSELSEGQLDRVEEVLRQNSVAINAMMMILGDIETPLVVRIGLSAIIESIVDTGVLNNDEAQFIDLSGHQDERIAIDAIYHLSLLATEASLKKLNDIAKNGKHSLKLQALDALEELSEQD